MAEKATPMKHDTPEFAAIAARATILRTQVGSGVHGTAIAGQDDRDEMGICIEPPEYVIGLQKFEQWEWRTQPQHVRSGPGDVDLVVYSLRKWMRLALNGNPTVLIPLFAPASEVVESRPYGEWLRAHPELVVSCVAGERFLGYLRSQRERLLGRRSQRTNRPELVEKYGYDTKFAMHMVRLGVQGVELLETGRITLPVPQPWLSTLREIRQGRVSKEDALAVAAELEARLRVLTSTSALPARPDVARAQAWMMEVYQWTWAFEENNPEGRKTTLWSLLRSQASRKKEAQ